MTRRQEALVILAAQANDLIITTVMLNDPEDREINEQHRDWLARCAMEDAQEMWAKLEEGPDPIRTALEW